MMETRRARISCSCCGEKSTIDVPLIEELSRVTICPNCGAEGNLLSDFFFVFPTNMENMTEGEIREVVMGIYWFFGEDMVRAMLKIIAKKKNSPISNEEVRTFQEKELDLLDNPNYFNNVFGKHNDQ